MKVRNGPKCSFSHLSMTEEYSATWIHIQIHRTYHLSIFIESDQPFKRTRIFKCFCILILP